MATPGKIVTAVASGSQETNVALATLNFDFSLVKLEAPPTFHPLGNLLSQKRKAAAESGSSHVTARKLGALFEQLLPSTPHLIEKYGERASEIAQRSENRGLSGPIRGIFADQAGIDGTSIWAAATSGKSAIAVHLLACMLARIFSGPEATSVWAELIEKRKKELANADLSEPIHIASVYAAQVVLSRDQLAEWDNSARAWLRAADEANGMRQTQLMLVLKNINVPVNQEKSNLYRSVISAWKRALVLMERLFCGVAQCITPYDGNGDLLLALASWHIYPDMDVLGSQHVSQKDHLVPPEAILTVGLECSTSKQDIGVYWSLPLARYRFYGPPKMTTRSLFSDAERVSFEQFTQVMLGSFLCKWDFDGADIEDYTQVVIDLFDCLARSRDGERTSGFANGERLQPEASWLRLLAEAAKALKEADGPRKAMHKRLVGVGVRRAPMFLHDQPPLFGLTSFSNFFALLKDVPSKIEALRKLADRIDFGEEDVLIRYRNPSFNENGSRIVLASSHPSGCVSSHITLDPGLDFSANEHQGAVQNRSCLGTPNAEASFEKVAQEAELSRRLSCTITDHRSQIITTEPELPHIDLTRKDSIRSNDSSDQAYGRDRDLRSWGNKIVWKGKVTHVPDDYFMYASAIANDRPSTKWWAGIDDNYQRHRRWIPAEQTPSLVNPYPEEEALPLRDMLVEVSDDERIKIENKKTLFLAIGKPNECALFTSASGHGRSWALQATLSDIEWALESDAFDTRKLEHFISSGGIDYSNGSASDFMAENVVREEHLRSRRALATIAEVYSQLPQASVALKVITTPLSDHKWLVSCCSTKWSMRKSEKSGNRDNSRENKRTSVSKIDDEYTLNVVVEEFTFEERHQDSGFAPLSLTRGETFALIATFETGSLNPDPAALSHVMAMSSGDSIFVAAQLLVDPVESQYLKPSLVCRIQGNIGKPGVVMLIPPPELQVKPRDSADWKVINHSPFDGDPIDSFQGTSLHLSFTEYSRAIDTGIHGVRDAEIYFIEAIVQVFDKGGGWIGDVDIISALESEKLAIFDPSKKSGLGATCNHANRNVRAFRVIAIDNWDEFVDCPEGGTIVRAKDNWLARLASTSLSVQRRDRTVVMKSGSQVCWPCIWDRFELWSGPRKFVLIC